MASIELLAGGTKYSKEGDKNLKAILALPTVSQRRAYWKSMSRKDRFFVVINPIAGPIYALAINSAKIKSADDIAKAALVAPLVAPLVLPILPAAPLTVAALTVKAAASAAQAPSQPQTVQDIVLGEGTITFDPDAKKDNTLLWAGAAVAGGLLAAQFL